MFDQSLFHSNPVRRPVTTRPLDRIDRQIVRLLQKDARLSNKELAAAVSLAPSSCHARVARLVDEGVLRGFHGDVDPHSLGVHLQAMVSVQLAGNPRTRLRSFLKHARTLKEVIAVYHIAGRNDLLLHIAVRDVQHMRSVVMDGLSSRAEVAQVESALIYEHERGAGIPDLIDPEGD